MVSFDYSICCKRAVNMQHMQQTAWSTPSPESNRPTATHRGWRTSAQAGAIVGYRSRQWRGLCIEHGVAGRPQRSRHTRLQVRTAVDQSQCSERAGQHSNTNQHTSLRSRWSSSTSSRISSGSCARCHPHSRRPASSRSSFGAAARAALIA